MLIQQNSIRQIFCCGFRSLANKIRIMRTHALLLRCWQAGTLVVAEHDGRAPKSATLSTLTAAGQLGHPVTLLVAGQGVEQVAQAASACGGVKEVRWPGGALRSVVAWGRISSWFSDDFFVQASKGQGSAKLSFFLLAQGQVPYVTINWGCMPNRCLRDWHGERGC